MIGWGGYCPLQTPMRQTNKEQTTPKYSDIQIFFVELLLKSVFHQLMSYPRGVKIWHPPVQCKHSEAHQSPVTSHHCTFGAGTERFHGCCTASLGQPGTTHSTIQHNITQHRALQICTTQDCTAQHYMTTKQYHSFAQHCTSLQYTALHILLLLWTTLYNFASSCIALKNIVQICTTTHSFAPQFRALYHNVQLSTTMYSFAQHCTPP